MTALAIAMLLTGAGGLAGAQGGGASTPPPAPMPPPPIVMVPAPSPRPWDPSLPRRARENFNSYFSVDDYPAAARRARIEGRVGYSLVVGPDGRVSHCTVTASSGSRELDAATCRILRSRPRYTPARNAAGEPVSGPDSGVITWRLPAEGRTGGSLAAPVPAPPPASRAAPPQRARANLNSYFSVDDYPASALRARHQGTTGFALTIGEDGRVSDCRVTVSSGSAPLDEATCRILRSRARYLPARTADGLPTTGRDSGRVTYRLPDDDGTERAGLAMSYVPARPLTPDADLVRAADVPPGAAPPTAEEGISALRVAVGLQGQVIGCDIETSSGSPALDAAACRLFSARARFEPGRNQAGAAVCDITWTDVAWSEAFAGRRPPRPGRRAPAARPPRPLREQLNARLCPGWPVPVVPPPAPVIANYPAPPAPPPPPRVTPPLRARANLNSYFSVDDYPAAALRANAQGSTGVSIVISPGGRVADCVVTSSSGSAALDEATCRILTSRARYTPARDADGNPASGRDSGRIIWRLPAE